MDSKSVVCLLMAVCVANSYSAYLPATKENAVNREAVNSVLLYGLRSTINHCSVQKDVSQCIKKYMLKVLDNAVHNKDDWVMNEYISLKKNPEFTEVEVVSEEGRSFEDTVEQKLENLFESRLFQLSFANQNSESENFEARKHMKEKKPKKGMMGMMMDSGMGMMMMGKGMLLMSLISKMFYGKVALLAVSAFIFSKIALMLSALVALKKLMMGGKGGSGGDSQQHVVYKAQEVSHQDSYGPPAGGNSYGGGHNSGNNGGGWGRTLQESYPNGDELAYNGHIKSS